MSNTKQRHHRSLLIACAVAVLSIPMVAAAGQAVVAGRPLLPRIPVALASWKTTDQVTRKLDTANPWDDGEIEVTSMIFSAREIPRKRNTRSIDTSDPWLEPTAKAESEPWTELPRVRHRALDTRDPWSLSASERHGLEAVRSADKALRLAIKAAVDAGDFHRAAALLRIFEESRATAREGSAAPANEGVETQR